MKILMPVLTSLLFLLVGINNSYAQSPDCTVEQCKKVCSIEECMAKCQDLINKTGCAKVINAKAVAQPAGKAIKQEEAKPKSCCTVPSCGLKAKSTEPKKCTDRKSSSAARSSDSSI